MTHAIVSASAAEGADGLRPQDLQSAYFPGEAPDAPASEPQTIAIVDAYDDLQAESDLGVYDGEFHLPACTAAQRVLRAGKPERRNRQSAIPRKQSSQEPKRKRSAHSATAEPAVKQAACRMIEEVDGGRSRRRLTSRRLTPSARTATSSSWRPTKPKKRPWKPPRTRPCALGAGEVSNSWAGGEPLTDSEAFNHPGTVITFAAGDRGYLNWERRQTGRRTVWRDGSGVDYPASSPHVVAVGGTSLKLDAQRRTHGVKRRRGSASRGGCSLNFTAQPWQSEVADWSSVGCEGQPGGERHLRRRRSLHRSRRV